MKKLAVPVLAVLAFASVTFAASAPTPWIGEWTVSGAVRQDAYLGSDRYYGPAASAWRQDNYGSGPLHLYENHTFEWWLASGEGYVPLKIKGRWTNKGKLWGFSRAKLARIARNVTGLKATCYYASGSWGWQTNQYGQESLGWTVDATLNLASRDGVLVNYVKWQLEGDR